MPIVRSISLDELTADLAKRTGNFSQWIRGKLIEEFSGELDHMQSSEFRDWLGSGKCNPMGVKGCCALCWPQGVPDSGERKRLFELDAEKRAAKRPPRRKAVEE